MRHRLELRRIQHLGVWNPVVALVFRIGARTAAQNDYFVRHVGTELYHAKISSALVAGFEKHFKPLALTRVSPGRERGLRKAASFYFEYFKMPRRARPGFFNTLLREVVRRRGAVRSRHIQGWIVGGSRAAGAQSIVESVFPIRLGRHRIGVAGLLSAELIGRSGVLFQITNLRIDSDVVDDRDIRIAQVVLRFGFRIMLPEIGGDEAIQHQLPAGGGIRNLRTHHREPMRMQILGDPVTGGLVNIGVLCRRGCGAARDPESCDYDCENSMHDTDLRRRR